MNNSFEQNFSTVMIAVLALGVGYYFGEWRTERDIKRNVVACTASEDIAACIDEVFELRAEEPANE